jgi:Zn-dependent metalloprotease
MATRTSRLALTLVATALVAGPLCASRPIDGEPRISAAATRLMAMRADLGLDSQHSFKAVRSHDDELGQSHVRFQQTYQGLRILGGEAIAHVDRDGNHLPLTHDLKRNINISTVPSLLGAEALGVATTDLNPRGAFAYEPTVELVVMPIEQTRVIGARAAARHEDLNAEDLVREVVEYRLAYHVHTELQNGTEETAHTDYLIDAHSGAILKKWDTLHTTDAIGSGKSQFSGTVSIHTNLNGSSYELKDTFRPMNISTFNLNHGTGATGTLYTDADNVWGDGTNYTGSTTSTTGATGQTAAVDAHYGIEMTYDYYKNIHGRNGIDNANRATYSLVHYSTSYDNAFWSDTCFCMTYGDGNSFKSLESMDVAGHEMSHGVCANSANLTYSGESGGLNESNSDIFGNMVELFSTSGFTLPATTANTNNCWLVGEALSATPLRYMTKPSKDGASKDAWSSTLKNLDVHYSSGPNNRMFFFLSQGATATAGDYYSSYTPSGFTGIGPAKAAAIWYRALTAYMTSSTAYAGARTACISAAKDLYGAGSTAEQAVWNAYAAINVGTAWTGGGTSSAPAITSQPANATVTVGATATFTVAVTGTAPFTYQWRKNGANISGATATSYTTPATTTTDSGATFSVVVTNAIGSVTSSNATLTVTATPPAGSELILNGGFESGVTSWTGTTASIGTWTGQPAYAGTKNAWLMGNGKTTTESLLQQITIPSTATAATLSFYLHIDTAETTTATQYDKFYVRVRNSAGTTLATLATYSNLNKATGYALKSFSLLPYKGQTIQIYFYGTEDSSLQTSFVLDNVSVKFN